MFSANFSIKKPFKKRVVLHGRGQIGCWHTVFGYTSVYGPGAAVTAYLVTSLSRAPSARAAGIIKKFGVGSKLTFYPEKWSLREVFQNCHEALVGAAMEYS